MSGRKPKKNASRPDAADRYYVPYTADELAESRGQRKFLNAVSTLNARLWMCVHFAECACEAIRAGDHSRAYSYFRALDIGNGWLPGLGGSATNNTVAVLASALARFGRNPAPRPTRNVVAAALQMLVGIAG